MSTAAAQDPDERFDLVDRDGAPRGLTKRRADVHRDGDWHRAIHLWVVNVTAPTPWVLLQRRSARKDTWPDRYDVSVAGHLGMGEDERDALREADEEIGLTVERDAPHLLGHVRTERHLDGGVIDREIVGVYALVVDRPLDTFRPNAAEVSEVVALALDDAHALWSGTRVHAQGVALTAKGERLARTVDAHALCGPDGGLRARALAAIRAWLAGDDAPPWTLSQAL